MFVSSEPELPEAPGPDELQPAKATATMAAAASIAREKGLKCFMAAPTGMVGYYTRREKFSVRLPPCRPLGLINAAASM
jgi:hypothetical protein